MRMCRKCNRISLSYKEATDHGKQCYDKDSIYPWMQHIKYTQDREEINSDDMIRTEHI